MNKKKINVKLFQKALNFLNAGRLDEGEKILKVMLITEPNAIDIRSNLGYVAYKRGDYLKAYEIYASVKEDCPDDPALLNRFAASAMHVEKCDEAEAALQRSVELAPDDFDSWINLCALAGFQRDDIRGLQYATKALAINPRSASAYVNLGSCLQMCNRLDDASHAFETALMLDPKQLGAIINLGVIAAQKNVDEKAIEYFDAAISLTNQASADKENEAKFYKSISLLKLGRLDEAWQLYDCGFYPSLTHGRAPKRSFSATRWDGQAFGDTDTLLCWKEQGIGDELLFLSCLPQLQQVCKNVIVECDVRLVSSLSRSFPDIHFREALYFNDPLHSPVFQDYNYHIPIGSLFGLFRPNLSSFDQAAPIIKPMDELVTRYRTRVGAGKGRLKIGICWRSGNLSATRNIHYTAISEWGPIFSCRDDADFFSFQYGDCQDELRNASSHFGIHINAWPDIDYKNSFEDLFALASAMDVVITVGTAVSTIAASVGTPTILMTSTGWTNFGTDRFPTYPAVKLLQAPDGGAVSELIPQVAAFIKNL